MKAAPVYEDRVSETKAASVMQNSRQCYKTVFLRRHFPCPCIPVTHCPYVHTIYYKEIQKKEILIMCCFFNNRCVCCCRNNNWGCGWGCNNNNNDWRRSRAYRAGFNDGYAVGFRDGFNAASGSGCGCGCNNNWRGDNWRGDNWRGGVSPLNESEGCGCDN